MVEVLANALSMVVIVLQDVSLSNRRVVHLNVIRQLYLSKAGGRVEETVRGVSEEVSRFLNGRKE